MARHKLRSRPNTWNAPRLFFWRMWWPVLCAVLISSKGIGQASRNSCRCGSACTGAPNSVSLGTDPGLSGLAHSPTQAQMAPWLPERPCWQEVGWSLDQVKLLPLLWHPEMVGQLWLQWTPWSLPFIRLSDFIPILRSLQTGFFHGIHDNKWLNYFMFKLNSFKSTALIKV